MRSFFAIDDALHRHSRLMTERVANRNAVSIELRYDFGKACRKG